MSPSSINQEKEDWTERTALLSTLQIPKRSYFCNENAYLSATIKLFLAMDMKTPDTN